MSMQLPHQRVMPATSTLISSSTNQTHGTRAAAVYQRIRHRMRLSAGYTAEQSQLYIRGRAKATDSRKYKAKGELPAAE